MPSLPPYLLLKNFRHLCAGAGGRVLFFLLLLFFSVKGFGQEENGYEEVSVLLSVPRIGNTEILVLIKNEEAWIGVKEVFDYLKIKNTISANLDSLSGFFIDPKSSYLIEKTHNRIVYKEKILDLSPSDLVQTETGLYLRSAVFCQVFGLDCQFSFRNLSFTLKTNIELPALREMQQEQMRKNLSQLKGEKKADTTLKRNFNLLHFGMADWSVTAMQESNSPHYLRANLALGAIVAGGEATVNLNYGKGQPFQFRQQFYRWRYVNNDLAVVKQITAGRIATPTVSSLFAPLNGIQITNTPTTYRKSFGSYRYTGTTEPEWIVELYVNNILVDYVKADASGFFAFEIPIVYGNSAIKLKFYGPWGEENTREENIAIPFNFLPVRQLEYMATAGVVQDAIKSRFSRAGFNYGLTKRITLGGGAEYLSSVMQGRPMPFVNASVRLIDGIILNGEYTKGVRTKGTLNYRLPSNLQLDLSYTKYDKAQTAIRYNYLEERKASLTVPIHLKKFTTLSRLTYNRYVLPKYRYSNAELLLSSSVAGVSTNLRTYAQFTGTGKSYIYSNLSLSFRLPFDIRFSPQAQYQYDQKGFGMLKADAEKRISDRGYLKITYENNRYLHLSSFTLGLRYDLSFARSFFSARRGNGSTITTQSASGSLIYEGKAGYASLNNQVSVGRGGFLVVPFLDLNCNGRRDKGEPRVDGLNLRVSGGRVERRKDSSLLISGLEAYTSYLIELNKSSFDNIAWQIKNSTIKAVVEPNRLRVIEVPVAVLGEASGMVYLQKGKQKKGLSRILVNFYDSSSRLVAKTLTEGDGYFSYLGLAPGRYTARMDTAQLGLLNVSALPDSISFTIASSEEGVVADGFEFILQSFSDSVIEEEGEEAPTGVLTQKKETSAGKKQETPAQTGKQARTVRSTPVRETRQPVQARDQKAGGFEKQNPSVGGQSEKGIQNTPGVAGKKEQASKKAFPLKNRQQDSVQHMPGGEDQKLATSANKLPAAGSKLPNNQTGPKLVKENNHQPPRQTAARYKTRQLSSAVKKPRIKVSRNGKAAVTKKTLLAQNRKKLVTEQQRLSKRNKQVFQKLEALLKEQRELIKKQRALIEEIRQLRMQLLLKKGNKR